MQWYSQGGGQQPPLPSWLAEHPLCCRGAAFPVALHLQGINCILAPFHDKNKNKLKFGIKLVALFPDYHHSLSCHAIVRLYSIDLSESKFVLCAANTFNLNRLHSYLLSCRRCSLAVALHVDI